MIIHTQEPGLGEAVELGAGAEVIGCLLVQEQVRGPDQRKKPCPQGGRRIRNHQAGQQGCDDNTTDQSRHQSLDAPSVELGQEGPAAVFRLPVLQRSGDHIARYHKKNVNPDIAARQQPCVEVIDDDSNDGDSSEAIDLGSASGLRGGGTHRSIVLGRDLAWSLGASAPTARLTRRPQPPKWRTTASAKPEQLTGSTRGSISLARS